MKILPWINNILTRMQNWFSGLGTEKPFPPRIEPLFDFPDLPPLADSFKESTTQKPAAIPIVQPNAQIAAPAV